MRFGESVGFAGSGVENVLRVAGLVYLIDIFGNGILFVQIGVWTKSKIVFNTGRGIKCTAQEMCQGFQPCYVSGPTYVTGILDLTLCAVFSFSLILQRTALCGI